MLRLLMTVLLLSIAAFGAATILPVYRERFRDKEIQTEQVDKKREEEPEA